MEPHLYENQIIVMRKESEVNIKENNYITGFSSFSVIVVFVMLMITGACFVPMLNIQLAPSHSLPQVDVWFGWYNASARVVEQEVTSKLESVFSQMKGLQRISSSSDQGGGNISMVLKKGSNLDAVRFELSTLIRQIYPSLPEGVTYPEISINTSGKKNQPILSYTLNASASPRYIQEYAEKSIAPELFLIRGIGDVQIYGGNPFEWLITCHARKLELLGITPTDVATAVNSFYSSEFIGVIPVDQNNNIQFRVLMQSGEAQNTLKWDRVPVKMVSNRMVCLTDIATVVYKEIPPRSYHRINGLNSVNLVIYAEKGTNSLKLARAVKDKIEALRNGQLTSGYSIILAYDATAFIQKELRINGLRTLFSILILMIFVFLISRNFRYLLFIALSICANLLIAVVFYYLLKLEMHLYSLAGITVSFGMLIDNSIIMIDQLRHRGNRKVFLAILAATLTTMGALSVVFFLKQEQRINLIDFSMVVIVNLAVSMFIALFFIPALYEKWPLTKKTVHRKLRNKRIAVAFSVVYSKYIRYGKRHKWVFLLLLIVGFGIPVHWLPDKIEKDTNIANAYNSTLGHSWFVQNLKPLLEKSLGGTLRLFTEYVFESSFYTEPTRTTLHINGSMPEGCTLEQMNDAVKLLEVFISRFKEVEMFQTIIYSPQYASLTVNFNEEYELSTFPHFLKEEIISKAIDLGGVDWHVYGVGRGFSNSLSDNNLNSLLILKGYNYDQLYTYAGMLKDRLLENVRIKKVEITGSTDWKSSTRSESFIDFAPESFAIYNLRLDQFYNFLADKLYEIPLSPVFNQREMQYVSIASSETGVFTTWDFNNTPFGQDEKFKKFSWFGNLQKEATGNTIYKEDQQYQLVVSYDFIGNYTLEKHLRHEQIEFMTKQMPLGYRIYENHWQGWDKKDKQQYYLVLLVLVIIFIICSILLESLVQPLVIMVLIPFSFIGLFLTFYLFDINFDQGGFASFVMLSGLVVNSAIFIVNDYNQLNGLSNKPSLSCYLNAFHHKITPVMLTVFSTMLGLVPFLWGGQKEVFWYSFAAGTIGGLVFSIIALIVFMPVLLRLNHKKTN
jgi:multidrug efflux pump subunit AcrB